jgi:hypothetical protein
MRIGIISEGHTDRAVIVNLLRGLTSIDSNDVVPIRPIDNFDETDIAALPPETFGSWTNVKNECEDRGKIKSFLSIEGNDYVIIQIDSAESDQYGINRPVKNPDYSTILRSLIIDKIREWLQNEFEENILYAISIEEVEAWMIVIYDNRNYSLSTNPKQVLKRVLKRKDIDSTESYSNYLILTRNFSKNRLIKRNRYLENNESLKLFALEIQEKILN